MDEDQRRLLPLLLGVESPAPAPIAAGRGIFLLLLAIWTTTMFSCAVSVDSTDSFMHLPDLIFHEAGHILFSPLGRFMTVLGGSLTQLLVCAGAFLWQTRDAFGAAIAVWWAGQNLIDLAPYINDARDLQLVLLGGRTGAEFEGLTMILALAWALIIVVNQLSVFAASRRNSLRNTSTQQTSPRVDSKKRIPPSSMNPSTDRLDRSRQYAVARFLISTDGPGGTMSHETILTRREFTVQSALAMLAGVAITISGCGNDNPPAPSPSPTDKTGAVSTDAGHSHTAVITAAQLSAGNAITVTLMGATTHTHTVSLSQSELTQISAGTRVQKTSTNDQAHTHTVTFN